MADNQPKTRSGFDEWKASLPKRLRYEGDYDLKGYYNKYGASKVKGEAHLTDEFKLPNHPTFSTESKYFNENTKMQGGEWDGDSYVPFDPSKPIFDEKNNKYLPNTRRAPQGQDYAQNENPLGMMVPEQTPFNFAQSSNPELYNATVSKQPNVPEVETSRLNNLGKGLSSLYEGLLKIPRYAYDVAAAPQNALSKLLDNPNIATDYDSFLKQTSIDGLPSSPLTMLDQLGDYYKGEAKNYEAKTKKYDDNIVGSIGKGKWGEAGSQVLDQITESAPSIATMAMTAGAGQIANAGQVTSTLANALPFMSQKNAQLQDRTDVPEWLKPVNATLNGLSEVIFDQKFGTQAAIQGIVNRFTNEGREVAVDAAKEFAKSFVNKAMNGAKVIKPFATGAIEEGTTQLAQNIVDKYTTDPDKDLMEGVADAMIVGSAMTGPIETLGKIVQPKARKQVTELQTQQQSLLNELGNPNITEDARKGVEQLLENNQNSIESIAKETQDAIAKLNPTQKKEVEAIGEKITTAESIVNDPNASEEVKKVAEAQIDQLGKEIDAIKPEPVSAKNAQTDKSEIIPVKKGTDVAVDDTVELVNGKTGKVTNIEGDQITMTMEDGATFMATPDLVEMSVVKPKEAVQETQTPVEVKEPVKEKEVIVEPKIESNETKLPVPEKENVVTETVPQEKPKEVIEPTPIEVVNEAVKEPTELPKKETTTFDDLANKRLPNKEVRDTKSNVERETGDTLTSDIKEFDSVDFKQSMLHGEDVVEAAKKEFGDNYVTGTLDYVKESKMPFENKAVILVSLENNLRKQLLEDPKNKQLRKQIAAATAASVAHLRSGATAAATGIFRQAARTAYDTKLALEAIFSPKQLEERAKVEGAVAATSEDIQESYEASQADIQDAIDKGVEERVNEIYESMPTARRQRADKAIAALDRIQKKLRGKTYDASIGVPIAIIDAGITTIKAAIRAGVDIADAIELGIKKIREQHGKNWEEDAFRQDMLNGFSEEGVKTTTVEASLKQELIDAGYGKEINVKTKNGKEKRNVLDWRKLTGIEGSFDTMKENLNRSFKGKGYSQAEIDGFEKQLQEDYNDIHAGIIEKSINELNRRNTIRGNQTKPLARRLAELYNLGLYDSDPATYENILNNALGINQISQDAFNEIKALNKSLAQLMDTRKPDGTRLSDVALAALETDIKNRISGVIRKVQFAEGNMFFKTSDVLKNLFSAMQRMMLVKMSQLIENPFSGKVNDLQVQLQDAFKKGKWDTKELAQRRSQISKIIYQDITLRGGDEYGGVGNPFTSKNTVEDFVNGLSKKPLYTLATAVLSGRIYLDAADSFFKIKRTEKEFTHNLLRILTDPSNPNGSMTQENALQYVSEALTGQSFEESKKVARQIIEDVNKAGGKELIRSTESNVLRVANDIVKDNLVNGGAMDAKTMEAAFKAGYHTAGKSIGHESNNIITDGVGKINELIQVRLQEALKRKDYSTAAILNLTSILSKNIVNPFVGGGTNWTILGLQKIGLPTEFLRSDVGVSKKPIDLSTKEGLKDLQKNLAANAERSRMYGRMAIGTFAGLSALLALKAIDDDDDYLKWLKKHPEARKLINKLQPVPITLALAADESGKDLVKAVFEVFGSRQNFDALKVKTAAQNFYEGYAEDNEADKKKAWGAMGELIGRRTNVPYISALSNFGQQEQKLKNDFIQNPSKADFKASKGFINGYYKGGFADWLLGATGVKEEGTPFIGDENLSPADIKKAIKKAQEDLRKKRNSK